MRAWLLLIGHPGSCLDRGLTVKCVANRSGWCGRPGHRFRRTHPSPLARILQTPAPRLAGKQGFQGDPTSCLSVDAVEVRSFGEWEVRGDAEAETRFRFRTGITRVVPWRVVSEGES